MYVQSIEEVVDEEDERKKTRAVFIIVYWSGNHIRDKLHKICDSFNCKRYEVPNQREMPDELERTKNQIDEARNVY